MSYRNLSFCGAEKVECPQPDEESEAEEAPLQAENSMCEAPVIVKAAASGNSLRGHSALERHRGFRGMLDLFGLADPLAGDLELNSVDVQHTPDVGLCGSHWDPPADSGLSSH